MSSLDDNLRAITITTINANSELLRILAENISMIRDDYLARITVLEAIRTNDRLVEKLSK